MPIDETARVFIAHGTKKFLERAKSPLASAADVSTTALGPWYANALSWKPQLAMFVNESTLLPVLIPLAPASSVLERFPGELRTVLQALDVDRRFTDSELAQMGAYRVAKTANRSVLGTMNDFVFMAEHSRRVNPHEDLLSLSLWLASTPCGPRRGRGGFPELCLKALVVDHLA